MEDNAEVVTGRESGCKVGLAAIIFLALNALVMLSQKDAPLNKDTFRYTMASVANHIGLVANGWLLGIGLDFYAKNLVAPAWQAVGRCCRSFFRIPGPAPSQERQGLLEEGEASPEQNRLAVVLWVFGLGALF